LLGTAQSAGANLVVLSGDSHNGWAFDHSHVGQPAGVEFAGMSVTSSGFEAYVPAPPADVAAALLRANPGLTWADTARRGYMAVELTPDRATSTWRMWDSVRDSGTRYVLESSLSAVHGSNRLTS
jgi:alkaline phosphatase D